jgi:hypothetical protein
VHVGRRLLGVFFLYVDGRMYDSSESFENYYYWYSTLQYLFPKKMLEDTSNSTVPLEKETEMERGENRNPGGGLTRCRWMLWCRSLSDVASCQWDRGIDSLHRRFWSRERRTITHQISVDREIKLILESLRSIGRSQFGPKENATFLYRTMATQVSDK